MYACIKRSQDFYINLLIKKNLCFMFYVLCFMFYFVYKIIKTILNVNT